MTVVDPVHGRRDGECVLSECQARILPAMRAAVDGLPRPLALAAGYHFGWLDRRGASASAASGKLFRPALTLLSAEAVGGCVEDAVAAGVAVELAHNFSLLHDDVMDGDRERRHRPAVWVEFGVAQAVLAGDALWALALRVLVDAGPPLNQAGLGRLVVAFGHLMAGQSADLDLAGRRCRVEVVECTAMAADKTAALLGCACALGALAGGAGPTWVELFHQVGVRLGMAFQLVDDLLGIWGDPATTGKPAGADLVARKKSLPVAAALASGTPAGAELARIYDQSQPVTPALQARITELVDAAGGRDWAQAETDRHLAEARALLSEVPGESAAVAELIALADLLARRDR